MEIDGTTLIDALDANCNSGFATYNVNFTGTGSDAVTRDGLPPPGYADIGNVSAQAAVPEPASIGIFSLGAVSIGVVRRRRRVLA